MTERNPYNFVPFELRPTPGGVFANLDCYQQLSGWIEFDLITRTPLLIHQDPSIAHDGVYRFAHLGGRPTLPATSLKGMLRSVHEVVTNSTIGILNLKKALRERSNEQRLLKRIPSAYQPGQSTSVLTASEIVFGMVGGDESVGQAGRVWIDDIPLTLSNLNEITLWRPKGGQPKPEHESFYFHQPSGQALGRKFYYHQAFELAQRIYAEQRQSASEAQRVQVVPKQQRLHGRMRFQNLSRELLTGLIYALQLEPGMAHKLGYGKGLGMGSLQIEITALSWFEVGASIPQRLLSLDPVPPNDRCADIPMMLTEVATHWQQREGGLAAYQAFHELLRWQDTEQFIYPHYNFFRSSSKLTLAEYQRQALTSQQRTAPSVTDAVTSESSADQTAPLDPPVDDQTRYTGHFMREEQRGWGVRDTQTGDFFIVSPPKLLKALIQRSSGSDQIAVSYQRIRRVFENETQVVAIDVRIEEPTS